MGHGQPSGPLHYATLSMQRPEVACLRTLSRGERIYGSTPAQVASPGPQALNPEP